MFSCKGICDLLTYKQTGEESTAVNELLAVQYERALTTGTGWNVVPVIHICSVRHFLPIILFILFILSSISFCKARSTG
jgi:hypothetical protein